jgi:hypothetical protein
MRNTLFLLLALLSFSMQAIAQPEVSLSVPFDEPEDVFNKVLQLRTGNTFLFSIDKGSIDITVYDKQHKQIAKRTIKERDLKSEKIGNATVNGIYDIGGEPVVFITILEGREPSLYRLRFNPDNGTIREDIKIATMPKYKAGSAWAMAYGDVQASEFQLEKDPASDAYAVMAFHGFANESKERIKVYHFSGEHKLLSEAYYGDPGKFKFLDFIAMTVDKEKVTLASYGYNTKSSGGKDSRIIVSRLKANETDFSHQLLDFTDDFKNTAGIMRYNPGSNKLQLLTCTFMESKSKFMSNKTTNYYLVLMTYIDPETLDIVSTKTLQYKKVTDYFSSHFKTKEEFSGLPQNMFINDDHTTTVISEELYRQTVTSSRGSVSHRTQLENIGLVQLDTAGEEISGTGVLKSQYTMNYMSTFFNAYDQKGTWQFVTSFAMANTNNKHFMSFDYIDTKNGMYVLFNDYPENQDKYGSVSPKTVHSVSGTNVVVHSFGKDPKSYYLFGKPSNDKDRTFFNRKASDYQRSTGSYATMIIENQGRKKQARIAWVSFK